MYVNLKLISNRFVRKKTPYDSHFDIFWMSFKISGKKTKHPNIPNNTMPNSSNQTSENSEFLRTLFVWAKTSRWWFPEIAGDFGICWAFCGNWNPEVRGKNFGEEK